MSLEQALDNNTAALKALHAQLAGGSTMSAKIDKVEKTLAEKDKPAAGKKTEPKADAAPAIDYEVVKTAALKLAEVKGREALVGVNTEFKVAKASELKPEQYAKYLEAVTKATGGEPAGDDSSLV